MNAGSGEPIARDLIPFEKYSINAAKTLARDHPQTGGIQWSRKIA